MGNSVSLTGSLNGVKTPLSVMVETGEGEGTGVMLGSISMEREGKMSVVIAIKEVDATIEMDGKGVVESSIEVVKISIGEESSEGVVTVNISSVSRLITEVSEGRKNESVGSISILLVKMSMS